MDSTPTREHTTTTTTDIACTLKASGYRVVFYLRRAPISLDHADVNIDLYIEGDPSGERLVARSCSTFLSVADLGRIVEYLRAHIDQHIAGSSTDSPVYVPLELGFQMQALSGEVLSWSEGSFSLRLMVCVGNPDKDRERVYVGCEGAVDVLDVDAFIVDLETASNKLQSAVGG